MTFPVTDDFESVTFNDGTGFAEVAAIHLAIKERADAIVVTIPVGGDYTTEWTDDVWLGNPSDATPGGDGRIYLLDVIRGFYDAIEYLVDTTIWTETANNGTRWTMESLFNDIGMGDYDGLKPFNQFLTKPANHEPFLWLHEALDRLVYATRTIGIKTLGSNVAYHSLNTANPGYPLSSTYPTYAAAWANRRDVVVTGSGVSVVRNIIYNGGIGSSSGYVASGSGDITGIVFESTLFTGEIVGGAYYIVSAVRNILGTLPYQQHGATFGGQNINLPHGGIDGPGDSGTIKEYYEWDDVEFTTDEDAVLDFTFFPTESIETMYLIGQLAEPRSARIYLDLTGVLTDQAP